MQFYFSGIASAAERSMLEAAGVTHLLVDPWQAPLVADWSGEVALDSGAYAVFKARRKPLDEAQRQRVRALRAWTFRVCDDVIGNPNASLTAWEQQRGDGSVIPVWTWGAPREHLSRYLAESELVGIGDLVPQMRQATALEADGLAMLDELEALAYEHPGRFHIFGLCNLDAIERLSVSVPDGRAGSVPLVASADSSKWLDAGRYGQAIFIHERSKKLQATRASRLEFAAEWDRARRCSEAARSIAAFCEQQRAVLRSWEEARELQPVFRARYTARAQARQRSRRRRAAAPAA